MRGFVGGGRRWRGLARMGAAAAVLGLLATGCYGTAETSTAVQRMSCVVQHGGGYEPPTTVDVTVEITAPPWADPGSSFPVGVEVIGLAPASVTGVPTDAWVFLSHPGLAAAAGGPDEATEPATSSSYLHQGVPPGDRAAGMDLGPFWTSVTAPAGSEGTIGISTLWFLTIGTSAQNLRCDAVGGVVPLATVHAGHP